MLESYGHDAAAFCGWKFWVLPLLIYHCLTSPIDFGPAVGCSALEALSLVSCQFFNLRQLSSFIGAGGSKLTG